jgi:hypothetical protein
VHMGQIEKKTQANEGRGWRETQLRIIVRESFCKNSSKKATPKNIGTKWTSAIWKGLGGKFRRATGFN